MKESCFSLVRNLEGSEFKKLWRTNYRAWRKDAERQQRKQVSNHFHKRRVVVS